MTTIDGVRGPGGRLAIRRNATGVGWIAPAAPEEPRPVAPGAAVAGLDTLLALQERQVDAGSDRRARRHGQTILTALGALQRGLLHPDGPDPAELTRLADLCDALPFAEEPGLRGVLQSIALRARIELARRMTA